MRRPLQGSAGLVLGLVLVAGAARAQEAVCAPQVFRFEEDCRGLAGQSLRGIDRLRYLPLDASGDLWLTLGGEYRARVETLDAPNFGVLPTNHAYVARGQRFDVDADLRDANGLRVFVQFAAALETGRKPAERPFDRSDPDLAQGFVELPLPLPDAPAILRLGRQELDLGGNRLVSVRDPSNLRRTFDMARAEVRPLGAELVGFWGRPVVNRTGAFDDTTPPSETFFGATVRLRPRVAGRLLTLDLFWLGRDRDNTVFEDASGRDRRRMEGARLAGSWSRGAWGTGDFAVQAAYQYGQVGADKVSAYGVAGDLGWRWTRAPFSPRLGLSFGLASGDRRRGDGRLNSYDPLYPNLSYFTDAPEAYPSNLRDLQPNLTLRCARTLTLKLGVDLLARDSAQDAIYASNGVPFLLGTGRDGGLATALTFLNASWRLTRHVEVTAAYVHGATVGVLSSAGAHPLDYGLIQSSYRF